MVDNVRFYPEQKSVVMDPLKDSPSLTYRLEGLKQPVSRDDLRLKFAFAPGTQFPPGLKPGIQKLLLEILDLDRFNVSQSPKGTIVTVPLQTVDDARLLLNQGKQVVPLVITLVKNATGDEPEQQWKCEQRLDMMTGEPAKKDTKATPQEQPTEDTDAAAEEPQDSGPENVGDIADTKEKSQEGEIPEAGLYSGLVSVDYGTSNSTVAVRDPAFASEEVRGQLGTEQWGALCDWINLWLSEHLAPTEPSHIDQFVQSITAIIPQAEIPPCGSPKSEIMQSLTRLDDKARVQILIELVGRLSSYPREGADVDMMKKLSIETLKGFESVIDYQNLESQRYFVLELDKNVGPAPIPSVLQVLHAPNTEDPQALAAETQIDMGARVSLLLRSATLGEGDIRQFVLSSKRYFGRNDTIQVVPSDAGGQVIHYPADILAKLTYKELFKRAVADIHKRAEEGKFQDAQWPRGVVATFPTSYPAALRHQLRDILVELNLNEIDTRFDEATAAALYYIWREIGADPVCGMHGLMARSRKDKYGRAYQNILLYDLGGGTTDVALIQLLYEEIQIFEEGDDRGNGGNYFRITPRLLGSTGDRYLGGDLITLWVFRYLKSRLADLLLSHIMDKNLEPPMNSPVAQLLNNLPEELTDKGAKEGEGTDEGTNVEAGGIAKYRKGSLLEWTYHPAQYLKDYNKLNEKVIDVLIPTRFANDFTKAPNFFTLWEITDEIKKTLGTPIIENFGTCLGTGLATNWPDDLEVDSGQLYTFLQMVQPWLVEGNHIGQDDLHLVIKETEMNQVIKDVVRQSISLAASLAKARLISVNRRDKIDRLILSGLSCNMRVVQDMAKDVFRESDGIFDYDPANVRFDRNSAKTAVALGACIGRYMESVRIDPFNEKTRQMLRDGYDQIELVIENLFSYLPCRIAYDSLVAMVPIFEQGQELNVKSYWDRKLVARTSLNSLRPVQEKFWVYRIDFPGAEPQYLGLINAEEVANKNGFDNFRKFREEYLVGFEADAELLVRAFFLPKGQNTIVAKDYLDPISGEPHPEFVAQVETEAKDDAPDDKKTAGKKDAPADKKQTSPATKGKPPVKPAPAEEEVEGEEPEEDTEDTENAEDTENGQDGDKSPTMTTTEATGPAFVMQKTIAVKEVLEEMPVLKAGQPLNYFIQYPDGTTKACCISEALHIRKKLEVLVFEEASSDPNAEPQNPDERNVIAEFEMDEEAADEATLICDQDGRLVVMTKCLFDIQIWTEIQYEAQKVDFNYDPFCGLH